MGRLRQDGVRPARIVTWPSGAGGGHHIGDRPAGAGRHTGRPTGVPASRPADTMTRVEAVELPGGMFLEIPDEPVDLRVAMRDALASGADWREGLGDGTCVGVWLWAQWRPALEPLGCSREDFVELVVASGRSVGEWLSGSQSWPTFAGELAGRVGRRLLTVG